MKTRKRRGVSRRWCWRRISPCVQCGGRLRPFRVEGLVVVGRRLQPNGKFRIGDVMGLGHRAGLRCDECGLEVYGAHVGDHAAALRALIANYNRIANGDRRVAAEARDHAPGR